MRKALLLAALVVLVMAGCASRQTGKDFRQITYAYTGGVAGYDQSLRISETGAFVIAEKGKPDRSGRVTAAELKSLRQLVNAVTWTAVSEQYADPRVADAITEAVTVQTGKTAYRTRVSTGGQPPAEVAQLLGKLKQILDVHR